MIVFIFGFSLQIQKVVLSVICTLDVEVFHHASKLELNLLLFELQTLQEIPVQMFSLTALFFRFFRIFFSSRFIFAKQFLKGTGMLLYPDFGHIVFVLQVLR